MKYCSRCGTAVVRRVPPGDSLPRFVCDRCGAIHYQNPKIVAGCIAAWRGKVLLCRRAIEPRQGLWTLPAGFMENGETTMEAAARETREEANAEVDGLTLYGVYSLPHISQVYILYHGVLRDGEASPGQESLDTALFGASMVPWNRLAFPIVRESLERYFEDLQSGCFEIRLADIVRDPDKGVIIRRH